MASMGFSGPSPRLLYHRESADRRLKGADFFTELRDRRIDHREAGEVLLVVPAIAAQQPVALRRRVRPDEEIGSHALAFAARGAVLLPRRACQRRRFLG